MNMNKNDVYSYLYKFILFKIYLNISSKLKINFI
jgi:hypothetical protein